MPALPEPPLRAIELEGPPLLVESMACHQEVSKLLHFVKVHVSLGLRIRNRPCLVSV